MEHIMKASEQTSAFVVEPFDDNYEILSKIGKGSYGDVYKAKHRTKQTECAVKKVAFDSDLMAMIKEISIMQQCDNPFIIKYYGSYFKDNYLCIVMEYCACGSVSDIMKLLNRTLTEPGIACILSDILKALEYLHLKKKIHRDIKAANILIDLNGRAKLADFGVASQLSDTMSKRNTVIGTPFWMSPELIQEFGYDCSTDIWSLGITVIEMFEGKPPHADIHPMRAIFLIPFKPPPTLKEAKQSSASLNSFLAKCLVKNPTQRASASELLQDDFVKSAQSSESVLKDITNEIIKIKEFMSKQVEDPKGTEETLHDSTQTDTIRQTTSTLLSNNRETIKLNDSLIDEESSQTIRIKEQVEQVESEDGMSFDTMIVKTKTLDSVDKGEELLKKVNPNLDLLSNESRSKLKLDKIKIKSLISEELKLIENEKDVVYKLSHIDVQLRLQCLNDSLEADLQTIRLKYEKKRALISDALKLKKKSHKN